MPVEYGASDNRAAIYTDRPIYRPAQTVYFRGVVRLAYRAGSGLVFVRRSRPRRAARPAAPGPGPGGRR